ncbi:MAG: hypothetical protein WBL27_04960 [Salinimicrobium sp.]
MSFGSAFGAIVSLKNNRRSKTGRAEHHLAGKESLGGIKSHRTPSAKELQEIRKRLQAEHKARQRMIYGISGIFLLLLLSFFFYFMF